MLIVMYTIPVKIIGQFFIKLLMDLFKDSLFTIIKSLIMSKSYQLLYNISYIVGIASSNDAIFVVK